MKLTKNNIENCLEYYETYLLFASVEGYNRFKRDWQDENGKPNLNTYISLNNKLGNDDVVWVDEWGCPGFVGEFSDFWDNNYLVKLITPCFFPFEAIERWSEKNPDVVIGVLRIKYKDDQTSIIEIENFGFKGGYDNRWEEIDDFYPGKKYYKIKDKDTLLEINDQLVLEDIGRLSHNMKYLYFDGNDFETRILNAKLYENNRSV